MSSSEALSSSLAAGAVLREDTGTASARPVDLTSYRRGARLRPVLSRGAGPSFVCADLLAWGAATLAFGRFDRLHLALLVVTVSLFHLTGAYKSRLTLSVLADGPRLVPRVLVAAALVVAADELFDGIGGHDRLLGTALALTVTVIVARAACYAAIRRFRARGLVVHRTLVLGAGRVGAQIVESLHRHPEYGLRVVGFLDSHPLLSEQALPAPVLGGDDSLADTISKHRIEDVIVAFGRMPESQLVDVIRTCDRLECEIFFVPRLFELHATAADMDSVRGIPLIRHGRAAFRSASWRLKRVFDLVVSAASLLLILPLLATIALAVRLEGGPGVIFRQTRVGLDGRPFDVLKFRSLKPSDDLESQTRWNVANDGRLGPVGAFIRRSSLDELPQLWNILRGDMSLVGPRPERPYFVDTFASTLPRYMARHRVPAGLTGWAQVHGLRGDTSISERARFDNYYIENWSLWLDVRIIVMTVACVFARRGA